MNVRQFIKISVLSALCACGTTDDYGVPGGSGGGGGIDTAARAFATHSTVWAIAEGTPYALGEKEWFPMTDGLPIVTESPAGSYQYLEDVWIEGENSIWGVSTNGNHSIVIRWDGATWTRMPTPTDDELLSKIWGRGENDIWVAGLHDGYGGVSIPLVSHWDGERWTRVADFPATAKRVHQIGGFGADGVSFADYAGIVHFDGSAFHTLGATDCTTTWGNADGDVWAACGQGHIYRLGSIGWNETYAMHSESGHFTSIHGTSSSDVWAVGMKDGYGVAVHWDGATWTETPLQDPLFQEPPVDVLWGIVTLNGETLAVGAAHTMLSWDGTKWSKRKSNLPDDASLIRGL